MNPEDKAMENIQTEWQYEKIKEVHSKKRVSFKNVALNISPYIQEQRLIL